MKLYLLLTDIPARYSVLLRKPSDWGAGECNTILFFHVLMSCSHGKYDHVLSRIYDYSIHFNTTI